MIDDHDECSGWMFLLVPAHPGCPGQVPQSRKMVVCVCVCPAYVIHQRTMLYTWLVMCIAHRWTTHMAGLPCNPSAVAGSPAYGVCHLGGRHRTGNSAGGQWQNCTTCRQWEGRWEIRNTYGSSVTRTMRGWLNNNGETLGQNRGGVGHFLID